MIDKYDMSQQELREYLRKVIIKKLNIKGGFNDNDRLINYGMDSIDAIYDY